MPNAVSLESRSFAFFDVDETLIAIKSMFDFFRYWCLVELRDRETLRRFELTFDRLREQDESREGLNRAYYTFFAGVDPAELEAAGRRWFARAEQGYPALINQPVVGALQRHAAMGVEPVFVSGSCEALLRPLADRLGVAHILSAPLLFSDDGTLSGELGDPQTIGDGKGRAIRAFLIAHDGRSDISYAYGDDISDLPMLESVGRPIVVGDSGPLVDVALERSWGRIILPHPKRTPTVSETARYDGR